MDLLATVTLAMQSSKPPPVGVFTNTMAIASIRLGENWAWGKDNPGYILFRKDSFTSTNDVFIFSTEHVIS